MKLRLALVVVLLQAGLLAFMAGQREWISRTGTPVTLRTVPYDPHDPMRGEYLRLNYEISTVPAALCQGETARWVRIRDYTEERSLRDRVVYASLRINPDSGLAELVSLSDQPPATGGLFLRGRVEGIQSRGPTASLRVRYGIEALFVSQTKAQWLGQQAREARAGAPLTATIRVDPSGRSVLQHYP